MRKFFNSQIMVSIVAVVVGWFGNEAFHEITGKRAVQTKNEIVAERQRLRGRIAYDSWSIESFMEKLERHVVNDKLSKSNISLTQPQFTTIYELGLLQSALYGFRSEAKFPGLPVGISWLPILMPGHEIGIATLLRQLASLIEPASSLHKILADAILSTEELQIMITDMHRSHPKSTLDKLLEGTKRQLNDLAKVTEGYYLTNGKNSD